MTNAKTELLELLKEYKVELRCGYLEDVAYASKTKGKKWLLKDGYSFKDEATFLEEIDFEYDSGFGSDEIGGILWFTDGTWADRGEYDGSEWWER